MRLGMLKGAMKGKPMKEKPASGFSMAVKSGVLKPTGAVAMKRAAHKMPMGRRRRDMDDDHEY